MGHLINSTSTRLGWFKHWWDVWFSKNSHYAELTMSCLRIRYFLIYLFFSREIMIKHLLLFSHFEMVKLYKTFTVKLFYYDGALEESFDDCLDHINNKHRRNARWRRWHRRPTSNKKLSRASMWKRWHNIGIKNLNLIDPPSKSYNNNIKIFNRKGFYRKLFKHKNFRKDSYSIVNYRPLSRFKVNALKSYNLYGYNKKFKYNIYLKRLNKWFSRSLRYFSQPRLHNYTYYKSIYIKQQSKIKWYLYKQIDILKYLFASNSKRFVNANNISAILNIIRNYSFLSNWFKLSKKFLINSILSVHTKENRFNELNRNININRIKNNSINIDLWALIRNFTRVRYDAPKRMTLTKKFRKRITSIKFNITRKISKLSRRYFYLNRMRKLGQRIKYYNKINYSNDRSYIRIFKKLLYHFRYYEVWSKNKAKRRLKIKRKNRERIYMFNRLSTNASFTNLDLSRLKKLYYTSLSHSKFKWDKDIEQIKFENNIRRRMAIIIYHWRIFVKKNLIRYVFKERWDKKWSKARKKRQRRMNNRQQYLARLRSGSSQPLLWRTFMDKFWWFSNYKARKRIESFISPREKRIIRTSLVPSHSVGVRHRRYRQPIYSKKKFMKVILQYIGSLPLEVYVGRVRERYISWRARCLQELANKIQKLQINMEEGRLQKRRWLAEKAKKKMLANPLYKWTSEEIDDYIFEEYSLDSSQESSDSINKEESSDSINKEESSDSINKEESSDSINKVVISQDSIVVNEEAIEDSLQSSKFFEEYSKEINKLNKELSHKLMKNDKFSLASIINSLLILPHDDKIVNRKLIKKLINLQLTKTMKNKPLFILKLLPILKLHLDIRSSFGPFKFTYKESSILKKISIYLNKKEALQVKRSSEPSEEFLNKYEKVGLASYTVNHLFKALMRGEGFRLRRFLGNKALIADVTRRRSIGLILFSAICSKWFYKMRNGAKFATIVLYNLFRFIFLWLTSMGFNRYISQVLEFLISTSFLQFKVNKIKFDFFVLANETINAIFLARFIANKFRQNLSVRKVLNPLVREFRRVTSLYQFNSRSGEKERERKFRDYETRVSLQRNWGIFFKSCSDSYSDFLKDYSITTSTWLSIDVIVTYIWLLKLEFTLKKVKFLSIYFTKRLNSFFITHISDIDNWFIDLSILIVKNKTLDLHAHPDRNKFFSIISRHIIVNSASFENIDRFRRPYPLLLKLASRSYYRFLKYVYWSTNYKLWYNIKAFNYSKARQKTERHATNLFRGFKIHCLGRFSRRQRSKSFWIHLGMVPLNNFNANIDYAFYTIPIKNSLICVKVWIHLASSPDFPDMRGAIY